MIHELKTIQPYYDDVLHARKTFEVRKDDRNFQVGDILRLREYGAEIGYTGNWVDVMVSYIFRGERYGIDSNYCVMGILRCGEGES